MTQKPRFNPNAVFSRLYIAMGVYTFVIGLGLIFGQKFFLRDGRSFDLGLFAIGLIFAIFGIARIILGILRQRRAKSKPQTPNEPQRGKD